MGCRFATAQTCGWPQIRRGAMWLACQSGVAGVATRLCCVEGVASLIGRAAAVAGAGGPLHGTSAGQRHCNDVSAGHKQPSEGL